MVREIKQDKRQNPSPSVNGQRGLYRGTIFHHGPVIAVPSCSLLFISILQQACLHKNPSLLPCSKILPAHPGRHSLFLLDIVCRLNLSSPGLQAVLPLSFSAKQGAGHSVSSLAVPGRRERMRQPLIQMPPYCACLWKAQGSHGLVPGKVTHHKELYFQS